MRAVVAPGADPDVIKLEFGGHDRLDIDAAGDLLISRGGSNVRMNAPASVIGAPSLTSVVHHSTAVRFPTVIGVPYRISMFDCVAVTRAQYSRTAAGPANAS